MAMAVHNKPSSRYSREGLKHLGVPEQLRREFLARWKTLGEPPITRVAPFTAHMLIVDSFFTIALGADLISRERPSNKVDIAYLYYLPFCMVFTSNDNLHARTVPLFMGEDQVFIRGNNLKTDLANLDAHYSALPDEVKARGVMSFAHYPPTEGDFLTSRLWDKFMNPVWRDSGSDLKLSGGEERDAIEEINKMVDAPRVGREFTLDEAEAILFKRIVPIRKGKWALVPPEVMEG